MAIDFRLRDFLYPVGLYRLHWQFERTQWLPPEELRVYQERRLASILGRAFSRVPYYRQLLADLNLSPADIRGIDNLRKLPVLTKDTLRKDNQALVADDAAHFHPCICRTSGTSGAPLSLYFDKQANILEFVYYWRHWSWAGYRLGDCFAELGSVFFLKRDRLSERPAYWQPLLRRLMLNSGQISLDRAAEMVEAIRLHQPLFLKGLASAVYFLALCIKESGITDVSFKAVFSTGETLTPQYRRLVESVFHCRVLDSYGHMERTVAISQCLQGGYHVNSDYGLTEFMPLPASPNTADQPPTARAIGTSLHNWIMPLIRYDTEDEIELFSAPTVCPCGRTLPLIKAIRGRAQPPLLTPDGRFVTSLFVIPELTEGTRLIQFVQESISSLHINVVPDDTWNDDKERALIHRTRQLVGEQIGLQIHRIRPEHIIAEKSGKIRTVISRVAPPPG